MTRFAPRSLKNGPRIATFPIAISSDRMPTRFPFFDIVLAACSSGALPDAESFPFATQSREHE